LHILWLMIKVGFIPDITPLLCLDVNELLSSQESHKWSPQRS
jgi:hypothetical protein